MIHFSLVVQTVLILFILEINIQALYGAGVDPEGSTGCSRKTVWFEKSNANGWCWRYCRGSSGKWCYTSKDCISDEEKCAKDIACPGHGCFGAPEGCVAYCPSPIDRRPADIAEPSGSTGCSKKWKNGRCWRYCKGSSGSWCYTRKGCKGDEESCANDDTCGEISCEGAAPGCVLKCDASF